MDFSTGHDFPPEGDDAALDDSWLPCSPLSLYQPDIKTTTTYATEEAPRPYPDTPSPSSFITDYDIPSPTMDTTASTTLGQLSLPDQYECLLADLQERVTFHAATRTSAHSWADRIMASLLSPPDYGTDPTTFHRQLAQRATYYTQRYTAISFALLAPQLHLIDAVAEDDRALWAPPGDILDGLESTGLAHGGSEPSPLLYGRVALRGRLEVVLAHVRTRRKHYEAEYLAEMEVHQGSLVEVEDWFREVVSAENIGTGWDPMVAVRGMVGRVAAREERVRAARTQAKRYQLVEKGLEEVKRRLDAVEAEEDVDEVGVGAAAEWERGAWPGAWGVTDGWGGMGEGSATDGWDGAVEGSASGNSEILCTEVPGQWAYGGEDMEMFEDGTQGMADS